jgi:hypothetical protein
VEPRDVPVGAELEHVLKTLSNADVLATLDVVLLELERRLLRYARRGPELVAMADEGLVLAVRAASRLRQALSSAQHTEQHLQVIGVGEWRPTRTSPRWSDDPRVVEAESEQEGGPHL